MATILGNLPVWLLAGLAPQVGDGLGLSTVALGSAVGIFFGTSAVSAVLAGRIVESIGWAKGMVLSMTVVCLAMAGMGTVSVSWPILMCFLAIGAIGSTIAQPVASLALAEAVPLRRQGVAFGLKQASLPMTTLLVGFALPAFRHPGSWRWAFLAAAALTAIFLAVLVVAVPDGVRPGGAAHRPTSNRSGPPIRLRWALLTLAAGGGVASAATASLGGFLVVYAVASGLTPASAGQLLALGSIVCIASRLATGYVADRRGGRHLLVVSLTMLAGSTGFAFLAVGGRWVIVVGTILAFGFGWAWNGLYAFAIVLNHSRYPALATGVAQTAICAGAALGPFSFGLAVSILGYAMSWLAAGLVLVCGGALVAVGRKLLARDVKRTHPGP